jgi:LAS superfamily LD-carboxypeptidase LdcB
MRFFLLFFCLFYSLLFFGVDFSHGKTGETVSSEMLSTEDKKNILHTSKVPFLFSQIQKVLHREDPIWDDASMGRFVTKTIPLSDKGYAPNDLVSMSGAHIDQAGRSSELRREAHTALLDMATAFDREFDRPIVVVSGYRSAAYQQRLWDLGRCTDTLCAPPGYSEHQL